MTQTPVSTDAARFLRTLRVATATALAAADLGAGALAHSATTFLALAAKGRDDWRFPAEGLTSADGLVRARLSSETGAALLTLQALGAAGLTRYAQTAVQVKFTTGAELAGVFDRDGTLRLPLGPADIGESDLAGFEIAFLDDAP